MAGIRHQSLHRSGDHHQAPGTGHRQLDPAGDRLRGVAFGAAGILSASPRTLRVYHTPEMQAVVADVVDRFVANEAECQTFSLRVITLEGPDWRARAQNVLHPVPVQTPGVSAWLLQREDAAVLLAELQRHLDYREHSSPHLLVNNGQSTVVSMLRPRAYVRDIALRPNVCPGYESHNGQIDEGFSLEFSPLMSLDRRLIDAAIKCNIDQVERLAPVVVEVPGPGGSRQRPRSKCRRWRSSASTSDSAGRWTRCC